MAVNAQQRMIYWTFALVLVLGALNLIIFLQPPRTIAAHSRASHTKVRAPASIGHPDYGTPTDLLATTEFSDLVQGQATDLKLPCGEKSSNSSVLPSGIRQVRLSGISCSSTDEIVSTEIINEANGFSATVFQPTPQTFTTDYISLAKGPNRIRILHIFKKGNRVERDYVVEVQKE